MSYLVKNIKDIGRFIIFNLKQAKLIFRYIINKKKINDYAELLLFNSWLEKDNNCKVCGSQDTDEFARLPAHFSFHGMPSLFYLNYDNPQISKIVVDPDTVECLFGVAASVSWGSCNNCGNVFLRSQITEDHVSTYYSKYYQNKRRDMPHRRETKRILGKYIRSFIKPKSTILEIGAGEGYCAGYLADEGHSVYVTEASEAKKKLLKADNKLVYIDEMGDLDDESCDCVYMHHVLEHLINPNRMIKNIYNKTKKGGLIIIQVPDISAQVDAYEKVLNYSIIRLLNNYYVDINRKLKSGNKVENYWMDALIDEHITAFTPNGLTYLLEVNKYRIKEVIQTNPSNIIDNSDLYAWQVDKLTGNTPNGLTIIGEKK
jgi:2-polyprenyl-3-methyl-5-hydroxy-6-metoxy-1,4-benzoquinol methylase